MTNNEFREEALKKLKGKKGSGVILLTLKKRKKEIFSKNIETTLVTILLELVGRKKPTYKWIQLFLRENNHLEDAAALELPIEIFQ